MGILGTLAHIDTCFEWACVEAYELTRINMDLGLTYYQRVIDEHEDSIKRIMEDHE